MPLFRRLAVLSLWPRRLGIRHLLILAVCGLFGLGGLAGLLLGLAPRRKSLLLSNSLALNLVEVTLNDRARHGADLIDLGNVNRLRGVITLIVEPVLQIMSAAIV